MLGYAVEDIERDFTRTSTKRYTTTKMEFPCFVVVSTEEKPVKQHSVVALSKMLPKGMSFDEDISASMINIYFNLNGTTCSMGKILPVQVKTFLRLFEDNQVDGYFDDGTLLSGDYLYVLAGGVI